MTKLEGELKREIVVEGVGPVIIRLDPDGISFRVKRCRPLIQADWVHVVKTCSCDRWPMNGLSALQYATEQRNSRIRVS
jgi:hypothetical protein